MALIEYSIAQKQLKEADFSDMFTGRLRTEIPPSLEHLCGALKSQKALRMLNVSDNAVGLTGVQAMAPLLREHRTLERLYITNCGLGPAGGSGLADALRGMIAPDGSCALRILYCSRNRLENVAAARMGETFAALKSLREVRLFQNGIRPFGISRLILGLAHNPELLRLDLEDNLIRYAGARFVARALEAGCWPNLASLILGDCMVGSRGTERIVRALATKAPAPTATTTATALPTPEEGQVVSLESLVGTEYAGLRELNLAYAEASPTALAGLPELLRVHPLLSSLVLSGNELKADTLAAIRAVVRDMTCPELLNYSDDEDSEADSDEGSDSDSDSGSDSEDDDAGSEAFTDDSDDIYAAGTTAAGTATTELESALEKLSI
ncbi:hypothetical protein H696_03841 [Fonticula alba]|uniref:Ran GTPase-activating protein 1 n=1 Tax=Fonticula alba TaxID=691883 RepID=A0A058Z577_FONAL|nr:hypothetical protein H696_03841 [Fonticula alba]KCV69410.1 hypothetical protein H696_03841 [Fonticula alba]|eukprot:XP_009495975.1 hypothetical protein H696_03841 [Fonticula alba]